jgi:hypothetical protein
MCKVPRYFSKVRPHLSRNIFLDFPNLSGNTESKEQNSNIFAVFKARLEELLVNKRKRGFLAREKTGTELGLSPA